MVRTAYPRSTGRRADAAMEHSPKHTCPFFAGSHPTFRAFHSSAGAHSHAAIRVGLCVLPECHGSGDEDAHEISKLVKRSRKQAALWPWQNHISLGVALAFGLAVFLNLALI